MQGSGRKKKSPPSLISSSEILQAYLDERQTGLRGNRASRWNKQRTRPRDLLPFTSPSWAEKEREREMRKRAIKKRSKDFLPSRVTALERESHTVCVSPLPSSLTSQLQVERRRRMRPTDRPPPPPPPRGTVCFPLPPIPRERGTDRGRTEARERGGKKIFWQGWTSNFLPLPPSALTQLAGGGRERSRLRRRGCSYRGGRGDVTGGKQDPIL